MGVQHIIFEIKIKIIKRISAKRLVGWVFLQDGMKCETKVSYHTALLDMKDIALAALISCFQRALKVSCLPEILQRL